MDRTQHGGSGKWRNLLCLTIGQTMIMSLWFSASAVVPQLEEAWDLSSQQASWLTISVQIGFVMGAIFCAILNINDRVANLNSVGENIFVLMGHLAA